jgi:hypothetical protein
MQHSPSVNRSDARVRLDDTRFPLVVQVWPDDAITDADVHALIAETERVAARSVREGTYYVCVTLKGFGSATVGQRKLLADLVAAMPAEVKARCIASYVVIESALQRSMMTALRWFIPEMRTVHLVRNAQEALAGADEALRAKR